MEIKNKIVPIDYINDEEHWVPIPGYNWKKRTIRTKKLHRSKGNCYFAVGVARAIVDFTFRAVMQLELTDKTFIFSKGSVKRKNRPVLNAIDVHHLAWDVGISMVIPRKLKYSSFLKLTINDKNYSLRIMELLILTTLLQLKFKGKNASWYSDMAANIIALGWKSLESTPPHKAMILNENI